MAGGTFTEQNKRRAGAYINVRGTSVTASTVAENGVVTLPLEIGFGKSHEIIEVDANTNFQKTFGFNPEDNKELVKITQALQGASKVLVYNLVKGEKAKATIGEDTLTVESKFVGKRGNDISVVVRTNVADKESFDVLTYLDTTYIDSQKVKDYSELHDNDLVSFSGTGKPEEVASVPLKGGTSEKVTSADYMEYFNEVDRYQFNVMGIPNQVEEVINAAAVNYVKNAISHAGKYIQLVVANSEETVAKSYNHEAVSVIRNGVILSNGKEVPNYEAVAWFAGASAGSDQSTSLTYTAYPNAVDAKPRLSNEETIKALDSGMIVFTEKRGSAIVEQDINTLTHFTQDRSQAFSKNRVIRMIYNFCNDSKQSFEDNFIGKVDNNVDGRELYKADRVNYLTRAQNVGAIQNFTNDDISVTQGDQKESVVMEVALQPVDAMEKLYLYVVVY